MLRCWVIDTNVERFVALADVSQRGARVLTATPPGVGERVELRFELPTELPTGPRAPVAGADTVIAQGRVVWRAEGFRGRGGVMGLAFESVSRDDALADFIGNAPTR